jgi:hypothetical protein
MRDTWNARGFTGAEEYLKHMEKADSWADDNIVAGAQTEYEVRITRLRVDGQTDAQRPPGVTTEAWERWPEVMLGLLGDEAGSGRADTRYLHFARLDTGPAEGHAGAGCRATCAPPPERDGLGGRRATGPGQGERRR